MGGAGEMTIGRRHEHRDDSLLRAGGLAPGAGSQLGRVPALRNDHLKRAELHSSRSRTRLLARRGQKLLTLADQRRRPAVTR